MAVGSSFQNANQSYLAVIKETTLGVSAIGTAATGASFLEFLSFDIKTAIDSRVLDTLGHYSQVKRVQLDRSVGGSVEQYFSTVDSVLMFAQALGGGIFSSSLTGAFLHSIAAGIMNTSPVSMSFNVRKGDIVFGYVGARVNTMRLSGQVGDIIKATFDFVAFDSTVGAVDITSSKALTAVLPLTFAGGSYKYGATDTLANTTTAAEVIQSFELTVNNNLKADGNARGIGSPLITILPPTRQVVSLSAVMRFDTTTTYNRFIQGTAGAVILKFTGDSITVEHVHSCEIHLPKVYYNSGDPDLGGPTDLLKVNIDFQCIADSTTGAPISATIKNNTASY